MVFYTNAVEASNTSPANVNTLITEYYGESKQCKYISTPIDFKTVWFTTLFTTLTGKDKFIVTEIWIHATSIAGLGATAANIDIGWQGTGYRDLVISTALPIASWNTNQYLLLTLRSNSATRLAISENTPLLINVYSATNSTTYTCTACVKGFYEWA